MDSEQFLKVVTFRFFSKDFAHMLIEKANSGVSVEVITTPVDAAKEKLRPQVEKIHRELERSNVELIACSWEAGEPRLTSTSMSGKVEGGIGRKWYSVHLQLLVNEKEALITSKNLTSEKNLDIYYLDSTPEFTKLSLEKFNKIKEIFLEPVTINGLTIKGQIIRFLNEEILKDTIDLFKESGRLKVEHYCLDKLPDASINKGLYICPFEGKLRDFLYKLIDSSQHSLYFFIETFFDEDLVKRLEEKIHATPGIRIKIMTRPPEMVRQDTQKGRNLIKQVLSQGIGVGYSSDIQAKFWICDKWLAIASGDFSKMNLGHKHGKDRWKEDTQLIYLDDTESLVKAFKDLFEQHFKPIDTGSVFKKEVASLFRRLTKRYGMISSKEAKSYVARLKYSLIIKTEKDVEYVINLAIRLTKFHGKNKVEGLFAIMAIILYYLQRREHKFDEISEKLENITTESMVKEAMARLQFQDWVLKSEGMYRVNVQKLLSS